MSSQVQDKNAKPVKKGDEVWTPIRGGKHQGNVDSIIQSDEEANEAGVKNPPKVRRMDLMSVVWPSTCAEQITRCSSATNTATMLLTTRRLYSTWRRNEVVELKRATIDSFNGRASTFVTCVSHD